MLGVRKTCRELANILREIQQENDRLKAENAKLFALLKHESEQTEKLRELVQDMLHDAMENVCSKAYWCGEKSWQTCNDKECGNRLYVEMARELGVIE